MTDKRTRIRADPGPEEIDLDERNQAIKELEEQRERDRESIKTMQKQIDNLQNENQKLERLASDKEEERRATQEDFDKLKGRTEELEEALHKSIKKDGFTSASKLTADNVQSIKVTYVRAGEMVEHWANLRKAMGVAQKTRRKTQEEDNNRRIILETDSEGKIVHVRCEE
jgi:predicted nuclease with TOPRIM domain